MCCNENDPKGDREEKKETARDILNLLDDKRSKIPLPEPISPELHRAMTLVCEHIDMLYRKWDDALLLQYLGRLMTTFTCRGKISKDFEPNSEDGEAKVPYQVIILKKFMKYLIEATERWENDAVVWIETKEDDEE